MNITYHLYIIYMTHDRLFNFCILISYISPPMFLPHLTPPDPDSARPPRRPGPSLRTQGPPLGRLCRIVQIDQEKVLSKTLSVAIRIFWSVWVEKWTTMIMKNCDSEDSSKNSSQLNLLQSCHYPLWPFGPRDWKGDIIYLSTVMVSINWCSKLMFAIPDKNRNGLHPSDTVSGREPDKPLA